MEWKRCETLMMLGRDSRSASIIDMCQSSVGRDGSGIIFVWAGVNTQRCPTDVGESCWCEGWRKEAWEMFGSAGLRHSKVSLDNRFLLPTTTTKEIPDGRLLERVAIVDFKNGNQIAWGSWRLWNLLQQRHHLRIARYQPNDGQGKL